MDGWKQWTFTHRAKACGPEVNVSQEASGARAASSSTSITTHEITVSAREDIAVVNGNFEMPPHVEEINIKQLTGKKKKYICKVKDEGKTIFTSW